MWTLVLLSCSWPIATGRAATGEMNRCDQSVVVLTDSWTSTSGVMHSFHRDHTTRVWKERGLGIPVVLGKNGLGHGRGLFASISMGYLTRRKATTGHLPGSSVSLRPLDTRQRVPPPGSSCLIWRYQSRSRASMIPSRVITTSWSIDRRSQRSIGAVPNRCGEMTFSISGA